MTQPAPAPSTSTPLFDQKTIVAAIALLAMVALAMTKQIDGTTVSDFVKWIFSVYLGGAFVQGAAQKVAIGRALQTTPESPARQEMIAHLKRS
jgi:hypothetical protein